ncbi:ATP-dependent Clp protease ATP-binding subunit ClpX [Alkaliphilus sp. B6464]|uniref:ATP-dependent Clp protease ATP-binding subunit ClpX n=1 Tax=Alkaliphilus sp. B6464 TaxID=2731219 RepID=UPI001BAC9537|nr:ATP-dependent Clp protease ATP-binding subunit ClpX [Alkaliphilus sp. B6464]QUH22190.1 ATP-dependent Clp protease ATP-binding subunit ClpX [Alkaliphilus sp. B6464]
MTKVDDKCQFCGNHSDEYFPVLVQLGEGVANACRSCAIKIGIIEPSKEELLGGFEISSPKEIYNIIDEFVIGHKKAKKTLATEIFKHYLRLLNEDWLIENNKRVKKSNILMLGPTGVGKTYLAQTLANSIGVPFAIADATTLTETGYVGEDVENIIHTLLMQCDFDVKKAEVGIVYIDEIDKLAMKGENMSLTRDVSGEGVQEGLLKLLEGHKVRVPANGGRKHPQQQMIEVDTSNILFIAGGAFTGIEDIVKRRIKGKKELGFGANVSSNNVNYSDSEIRKMISVDDLLKYGFKREFVGRFPKIASLEYLEAEDLINILKARHGVLEEYEAIFELMNKKLFITNEALLEIANKALERETGARALKSIMEEIMEDILFEAPSEDAIEYIISDNDIKKFYNESLIKIA